MVCESVHMDPAELIDSRPNDAPLALWRDRIVLSVHHDGAGAMTTEWELMTDRLPIYDIEADLIASLQRHRRIILQAPTGSGKSTQVPQMLLKHGLLGTGQAVILQPRRLAARWLRGLRGKPVRVVGGAVDRGSSRRLTTPAR